MYLKALHNLCLHVWECGPEQRLRCMRGPAVQGPGRQISLQAVPSRCSALTKGAFKALDGLRPGKGLYGSLKIANPYKGRTVKKSADAKTSEW